MAVSGAWAEFFLMIATGLIVAGGSALVVRYAGKLRLVQAANQRSSHAGEKATGGGIAIAIGGLVAGLVVALFDYPGVLTLSVVSCALALVGFQDDRGGLPIGLRMMAQFVAMFVLVVMVPSLGAALLPLPEWLSWILIALAGMVWINFYNFMDGIDGMAASQGACLSIAVLVLALIGAGAPFAGIWVWTACLAVAAMVFLFFNWQPSRLFMGDGGAYFLSLSLFGIALFGIAEGTYPLASAIILAGLFVSDAGATLLRRMSQGQDWREAHRTHAYQNLSRRWGHARTVLAYIGINAFWLLPLALIVQAGAINPWIGLVIAYVPLLLFVIWAKAGRPENAR